MRITNSHFSCRLLLALAAALLATAAATVGRAHAATAALKSPPTGCAESTPTADVTSTFTGRGVWTMTVTTSSNNPHRVILSATPTVQSGYTIMNPVYKSGVIQSFQVAAPADTHLHGTIEVVDQSIKKLVPV